MEWPDRFFELFFSYAVPPLLLWAAFDFWRREEKTKGDWALALIFTALGLIGLVQIARRLA